MTVTQGGRRDAVRNYHRILDAARDVLGESGAEASMEEIATRAGVGVGTVYRRFASKDALIDELVRLAMEEVTAAAEQALARADGHGLEEFLRAIGQSFADHARYANLLLERPVDPRATQRLRDAVGELTTRAAMVGTVAPCVTQTDIMALVRAMRGLVHDAGEVPSWPRFLDIHLAGLRAAASLPPPAVLQPAILQRPSCNRPAPPFPLTNLMNVLLISSWDVSPVSPPPRPGSGCSPRPPTCSPNAATTAPGSPTSPRPRG